ncbi:MAG: DUF5916 domain-containing protein [Gemmatirosa sp.]
MTRRPSVVPSALLALAMLGPAAHAQTTGRVLHAAATPSAPKIDGRLDEAAWAGAQPAGDFVQAVPTAGAAATERSEVRVLYDRTSLYVGYRLYDSRPDSIARQLARRDAGGIYTDWAHVAIDSYRDRRTAFRFSLSPRGVQADGFIFDDTQRDANWDAVWEGASSIDSLGWVAEFRIPLSQLRYSVRADGRAQLWGINFAREIARKGERSYWSPTPPDQPAIVSVMGTLTGLDSLGEPGRLELVPYVRVQSTQSPAQPANPLHDARDGEAAVGVDLRYRLPRNLTLSATVNPDFGQVEADPAVVNLSAFEIFFPERRPFFLEGTDVFRFGGTVTFNDDDRPTFFYTRRLGRAPALRLTGAEVQWAEAPTQTPILAAAKVSGKTPGGWSVGILGAATREQEARYVSATGDVRRASVEPTSGYGIARVRRDLRGGNTAVGAVATIVARDLDAPALAPLLPERAAVAGLDFEHAWGNRTWTVSGVTAGTRVEGSPQAMTRLQRAPYRLFQRADADHLALDTARTALAGRFTALSLARTGGRHWLGSTTFEETTPGFETNDLGFGQRADRRTLSNVITYRENRIGTRGLARHFRDHAVNAYYTHGLNFAGDRVTSRAAIGAGGTLRSFWRVDAFHSQSFAVADDRLTRGGPLVHVPMRWSSTLDVTSDSRRPAVLGLSLAADGDSTGRRGRGVGLALDVRPSAALRLRLQPDYARRTDTDQYVTAVGDPLATATTGRRYVFADIVREELALEVRADWTFSPTLSLQLFARPFAARGRYQSFKELERPATFGFATYGDDRGTLARTDGTVRVDPDATGPAPAFAFAEPEYAVRALRGNAVARWEFRPGSALFVVWQRQGDGALDDPLTGPRSALGGDVARAFRDKGRDVLLVKVSRWMGW